ncbi:MAG: acetyl-CoA decarbonylase/synthase complex subunit alpha/beta [Candidatus Alcyoniella australis]|nr:acetyl-CoA decarbonylase/synthase complex subunit alpha/beta [Candidatus Alcyoniella australis]
MSKIVASLGIQGAQQIIERATAALDRAVTAHGLDCPVGFPNTAYFLPVTYGILGIKVERLEQMRPALQRCCELLPAAPDEDVHLPYLGPALDAGMAALIGEELIEAIRCVEQPELYLGGEEIDGHNIWLGAADDVVLRKRGVEFVDGSAPGFAAILGSAPDPQTAVAIAEELQRKNLYVFMAGSSNGTTFAEQLVQSGVQVGWNTRLVPFGSEASAAAYAFGFATRAAMSFGGIGPGEFSAILRYNKERIFAFALTLGAITPEWAAIGLGALNYGFPIIADSAVPEVLISGVCTYEHLVADVPHESIVSRAIEARGLKVQISEVPVPVAYGPAYEGERVRGEDIFIEMGGGRTPAVEWTTSLPMNQVEDGDVQVIGPKLDDCEPGSQLPLAIKVEVAGRKMQPDFEPILERQIHHLLNYAQGVMHIGQRDLLWLRVSRAAAAKGFELAHLGRILHAKYHEDFGNIVDKVQVRIYTERDDVQRVLDQAQAVYLERDERISGMTDEQTDPFYSCTLCQSFAPAHVCIVTPERAGLCGAYSWLDCKASFEINPTGPNQPVHKGETLDAAFGQWAGVNEFVRKASRGKIERIDAYSIMREPMTACGCFECLAAVLPLCNGIMIVDRDHSGMTPCGMKFTTLAGTVGGGQMTPGFLGHSKLYISSRKFISAEGGIKRLVWMPRKLKEEIRGRFERRAAQLGIPDLLQRVADETVGTTEEQILPFLEQKQHPALTMDPIL